MLWYHESGVAPDAACLDGHFPGQPIVPGAYLLGLAAAGLAGHGLEIVQIRRMKFVAPLVPERGFEIAAVEGRRGLTLTWRAGETVLAEAVVDVRQGSD